MSNLLALFTSDPNLIRCELHRIKDAVALSGTPSNVVGIGSYAQDDVLLQRYGSDAPAPAPAELWKGAESEALLYHAQKLPLGLSLEENTQPFRFRHWLFAHVGAVNGFSSMRTRLLSSLPEVLQRQIGGDTDSEAAFALYLKVLRDTGRSDDRNLEPAIAAQLLGKTARMLEQLASEAGATGKSTLNFVATNGRMLIATRYGGEPLYYTLLEGTERCERCEIDTTTPDTQPLVREHRRQRTVAVTSRVSRPNGWMEIPNGMAIAVDRHFAVQMLPI